MQVPSVTFQSHLKTLWKRGQLPTVKKGLYGGELTKSNVTDEHILPKSKGGTNAKGNIALAVNVNNWKRGSEPIEKFLTVGMLRDYCLQFKGIRCNGFNGDEYVRKLREVIKGLVDD